MSGPAAGRAVVPGWALTVGLAAAVVVALGAAAFGWVGVAVLVAGLLGAALLLLRWARWPHPDRRRSRS